MSGHTGLVRLTAASKFYGERAVLRNVTLTAHAGEVLLVAGRNGAGKSTLLKMMAGLIGADEGSVDRLIPAGSAAYLGHQTFVYGKLSALDNLLFWSRLHGVKNAREHCLAMLERFGLAEQAFDPAQTFSRGMTQRLSLARVFALSPRILFLDEPDTGLDAASKATLRKTVAEARSEGLGVVWVSHDPAADLVHADRGVLLAGHRLAFTGPAGEFPIGSLTEATC